MENIKKLVEDTIIATKTEMLKTHKPFDNSIKNDNETLKSFNVLLPKKNDLFFNNGNLFEELMETVKYCSLGQITNALYSVGGQYRRNM